MILVCAVLLGCAGWLLTAPPPDRRAVRLLSSSAPARRAPSPGLSAALAATVAALAAWAIVGGVMGALLGLACLLVVPRVAGRLEPRAVRARREQLERQAPMMADLLAATLASGAPMRSALVAVADALGEPMAGAIGPVIAAIDLGAEPDAAWRSVADVAALEPVVAALIRSAESGAPMSTVLARIAEDLRRNRQSAVEVAARSAGVRAVAPLAACFLPAFLLLGVVPVVAALAGELLGS